MNNTMAENHNSSIIAISGKSGCGNTSVSRLLAKKLGIALVNYTFHTMADELGMTFDELLEKSAFDPSFDKKLDEKQVAMARSAPCVLGSRLAIWMIPEASLKIYLHASPDVRAERILKREGGTAEDKKKTFERDRMDRERYLRLYGIDNDDYSFADIVINTERFNIEMEASIIADIYKRIKDQQENKNES